MTWGFWGRPVRGALCLAMLISCSKNPATAVVLNVIAAEELQTELNAALTQQVAVSVRLQVRSSRGSGDELSEWRDEVRSVTSGGRLLLDATLTPTANDSSRLYEVVASVLINGRERGQARAKSGYARGRSLRLVLEVVRDCVLLGAAPTCSQYETCAVAASGCVNANRPASSLPDYASAIDAGLDGAVQVDAARDATVPPDAAFDVARDASVCGPGFHVCGNDCLPNNDPNSCGNRCQACVMPRNGSAPCVDEECRPTCPSGLTLCGTACESLTTSAQHCGACDRPCPSGELCNQGAGCRPTTECTMPSNCQTLGSYCGANGRCLSGCDAANDCPQAGLRCDAETHACVGGCDEVRDCPGSGRRCDFGGTQQCQCDNSTPIWCPTAATCRAESATTCGANCATCPAPNNGVALCADGQCDISCTFPAERSGNTCVMPWALEPVSLPPLPDFRDFGAALAFGSEPGLPLYVGDPRNEDSNGRVHRYANPANAGWYSAPLDMPASNMLGGPLISFGAALSASVGYLLVGDPGNNVNPGRVFLANLGVNPPAWSVLHTADGAGLHMAMYANARVVSLAIDIASWPSPTGTAVHTVHSCTRVAISNQTHVLLACTDGIYAYVFENSISNMELPSPQPAPTNTFGHAIAASATRYFVGDPGGGKVYVYAATAPYTLEENALMAPPNCTAFGQMIAANDNRIVVLCDNGFAIYNANLQLEAFRSVPASASAEFGAALALSPSGNVIAVGDPNTGVARGGGVFIYSR